MNTNSRIKGIQYNVWTTEQIRKESVVQISNPHMYDKDIPNANGLFDLHTGTVDKELDCLTCHSNMRECPGHWSHIELPIACWHALFYKATIKILHCICWHCSRILIGPDDERVRLLNQQFPKSEDRLREMSKLCRSQRTCRFEHESFRSVNPLYAYGCGRPTIKFKFENFILRMKTATTTTNPYDDVVYPDDVLRIFHRMPEFQFQLLGLSTNPEHTIQLVVPVPPPIIRPPVVTERKTRGDDDVTRRLQDIVRVCASIERQRRNNTNNNNIGTACATVSVVDSNSKADGSDISVNGDFYDYHRRVRNYTFQQWYALQVNVTSYYIGDIIVKEKDFVKRSTRQKRLKYLSNRIQGSNNTKEGRMRMNMSGKRTNQSGRSVISPDPNISIDEIGLPLRTAIVLTYPVTVNRYNFVQMQKYVRNGPYKYPGARFIKKRSSNTTSVNDKIDLRIAKLPSMRELEYGDVVDRHLIDGDVLIFNRQPSLHRMSMMTHRVRVLSEGLTFRMNPCATTPYNADFDGDEMNIHVVQSQRGQAEMRELMHLPLVSEQASEPVFKLVQDAILGCKLLSHDDVRFTRETYFQICMESRLEDVYLERVTVPEPVFTGRSLLQLVLPKDFFIKTPDISIDNRVPIWEYGVFNASTSKKIIHYLWLDYDRYVTRDAIDRFQLLACAYLSRYGFSIGYDDALSLRNHVKPLLEATCERFVENNANPAGAFSESTLLQHQRAMVSETASLISPLLKEHVSPTNRFRMMIDAGAKGSELNLQHVVAYIGQQDVNGRPVRRMIDNTRTLPHYAPYHTDPRASGFLDANYADGLSASQFNQGCQSGREGLIDTAVKTSNTGYIQRRLIKAMEELRVAYDGTIRNANGAIIQFSYGDDDFNGQFLERYKLHVTDCSDIEFGEKYSQYPEVYSLWMHTIRDTITKRKDKRVTVPFDIYRILNKYGNVSEPTTPSIPIPIEQFLKRFKPHLPLLSEFIIRICAIDFSQKWNQEVEKEIYRRWSAARTHPGDMNGTIAAQSVGEPATQMTLNTFHYAGVSSKNVTLGIPRLTELIDMTKHIKTPSVSVYFRNSSLENVLKYNLKQSMAYDYIDQLYLTHTYDYTKKTSFNWTDHGRVYDMSKYTRMALELHVNCARFMETRLSVFDWKARIEYACRRYYGKLVASIDYPLVCFGGIYDGRIMYVRLAKVLLVNNTNKLVAETKKTPRVEPETEPEHEPDVVGANADLDCEPEPETLEDDVVDDLEDMDDDDYNDAISEPEVDVDSELDDAIPEDDVIESDDDMNNTDTDGSDIMDDNDETSLIEDTTTPIVTNIDEQQLFDRFVRTILQNTIVSGIRGVRQTHITRTPETDDWFIETESENTLLDIMSVFGVDPYRCVTNDVIEVQSVLGLEAACRVLFEEIRNVLSFDGCYVNDRHPKLLVDTMAYYGSLQPVTRHGVNKYESSTLKKSTFEQPLDTFVNSGIHSAHDEMQGVTENLMMGQSGSMGTTMCDLQLDLEALSNVVAQQTENNDNQPLRPKMFF